MSSVLVPAPVTVAPPEPVAPNVPNGSLNSTVRTSPVAAASGSDRLRPPSAFFVSSSIKS
jgi:hypothetical protein